ncbi:zinc-finger domain-containing protein [Metabacillus sediminilitoris]|jgi:methionine aminopeptidase|uniref:Zinc-finger domain-containing protein n=1 Tax=Metabacillus sediminilitoris TaxID=2567941 RepID=A0A4S4BT70_9BACI|nr:zinc-finger domain-containing protein [Metabacillus sediminilitoris]QGQ46608.1 zinc-finger domain-containing protein [Metabacillus sediminilitoris]THF76005.1 zinc-finger domain-containing protein [Metabacillus sediminilitoris]
MSKKQTFQEINEILDTFCVDCLLKKHFRQEHGKRYAHSFCINQCTVGQKIKEMGEKLT